MQQRVVNLTACDINILINKGEKMLVIATSGELQRTWSDGSGPCPPLCIGPDRDLIPVISVRHCVRLDSTSAGWKTWRELKPGDAAIVTQEVAEFITADLVHDPCTVHIYVADRMPATMIGKGSDLFAVEGLERYC